MRSVLHALIWDSLRLSGLMQLILFACCMFPMGMYASIASIGTMDHSAGDPVMFLLEASMLPFVIFLLIAGAAVSYCNMSHIAAKPISNLSIAAWRMIGGSVLLAIQMALIVSVYNSTYRAGWPLAGAVLFTIAMWFAAQPFFCLAEKSILSAILTMIPIALMCGWFLTRYKPFGGGQRDWNEISVSETLQLLAVIGFFAWCTVHCVALARRGNGLPLPKWIGEGLHRLFNFPLPHRIKSTPFRSAQQAMFWYEWRWKGWALTASMLFLLAFTLPIQLFQSVSLRSYYDAVTAAYLGTMFPAVIMGVINGFQLEGLQISPKSERTTGLSEIDAMGSFQATRPVTDAQLSRSNLWVCLASIGLMTGLWLLLITPALMVVAMQGQYYQHFKNFEFLVVPLVGMFMWIGMSNMTALTSTGRTLLLGGSFIALAVAAVFLGIFVEWLGGKQLERIVVQSLLVLFTVSLIVLVAWSYGRSMQLGFVTRQGAALAFGIAMVIFIAGYFAVSEFDANSFAGILCAAILSVLPWATTPLATRWNRHR